MVSSKSAIKSVVGAAFCLAFIVLRLETCHANYSGPMRFSVFLPCSGHVSSCAPRIMAQGTIEDGTADKFGKFLIGKDKPPYSLPSQTTICFDSPGGSVVGAVNLGHKIRENGFNTCLESKYRRMKANWSSHEEEVFLEDAVCASACVFALAAGVNREIGEKARIGVHEFVGAHGEEAYSTTRQRNIALAGYLELMGVKGTLLDIASRCPPDQIYWLSRKEILQLKLENHHHSAHKRR
jgi:hypothetical protein